jgi:hypothetical protein
MGRPACGWLEKWGVALQADGGNEVRVCSGLKHQKTIPGYTWKPSFATAKADLLRLRTLARRGSVLDGRPHHPVDRCSPQTGRHFREISARIGPRPKPLALEEQP